MNANKIPTSKERKYVILYRLLENEHLSYKELSSDYLVSRSSIANDIVSVKKILSRDNVPLEFDNSGTYIGGGEENKQKIIKRIDMDIINHNSDVDDDKWDLFFDKNLFDSIGHIFKDKAIRWSFEVPENYLKDMVLSITILIQRGKKGYHITQEKRNQLGKLLFQFEKYPLIYELLKSLEEAEIYTFSQDELRYLSYIILGNGFKFFMKNASIPSDFKLKVAAFIRNVGYDINFDFSHDTKLNTDLLLHLYQMVLRLQSGMTVINPLLDEIKRNYSNLFGVVWYSLRDFGTDNNLTISDDEVAFVTIHFQAALERSKGIKKILFVCPHGIGTSSLLSAKLHQILPDIVVIEAISQNKIQHLDLSDVDLIITTIDIESDSVPVAKISPMLTPADMKAIMNKYIDLTMSTQSKTKSNQMELTIQNLKGNVYFQNLRTKAEVIEFLLKTNNWESDEALSVYRTTVFNREKLQSTYVGNGFVIPHGNPKLVKHSAISVLILDRPVEWNNNKADVISLLMISENDKKKIEPFMDLIMYGIKNKEWFISRMMEVK